MNSSALRLLTMKRKAIYVFLIIFSPVLLSFLTKSDTDPDNPLAEVEKKIRSEYDNMSVFTWSQYNELLKEISQEKFVVLPLNEMRNHYDPSKVVVGMRHDIDCNPFKAVEMATIEKGYGIRATYFILPTASYYGHISNFKIVRQPGMGSLYKRLYDDGAEIGIHNDLLAIMILYKIDPFRFNKEELAYFNSLKIPIYGSASHGSEIAKKTLPNFQIFSDFAKSGTVSYEGKHYPLGKYSLKKYGYKYEAYFIDFKTYFSDGKGKWNDPDGFSGILKKLEKSQPGDRIEILTHPEWWGKAESH